MKSRSRKSWLVVMLFLSVCYFRNEPLAGQEMAAADQLKRLSLEELLQIEMSITRKPQEYQTTAGAVAVLTSEQIRRSGAATIPDLLRLAPGFHVLRSDGRSWGVTARGLNLNTANKLQVLMDGRILYTPLFGGVFWDIQDYVLQDIDRIEVIRGPGAALWGGNAVNGVINIRTLSAEETQGGFFEAGGGNEERAFVSARYGSRFGQTTFYRGYFKYFNRDSMVLANGEDAQDDWQMGRGGFRIDSHITPGSTLTLQGDAYRGEESFASRDDGIVSGGNLLARWDRFFEGQSNLSLTAYYDRSDRKIPLQFQEKRNTFDVALQHRLQPWEKHDVVWGFNFRASADQTENIGTIQWIPQDRTISHFSGFLQDDISILPEKLTLILGTKVEDNTFSDIEVQPNVRIAWMPRPRHTIWGSVARAVRVPSRLDTDLRVFPLPGVLTIAGNPDFDPEEVIGVEGGYRVTFHSNLLIDTTVFHHTYDSLITLEPGVNPGAPAIIGNGMNATITGFSLSSNFEPLPWIRSMGNITFLHKELELDPNSRDISNASGEGNDPDYFWTLRFMLDPIKDFQADVILRSSGDLPAPPVPGYVTMDLRFAWWVSEQLELSITGQNLFQDSHPEFGVPGPFRNEVERGFYGKLSWFF